MNDKDSALYQIVDIVLSCCSSETAAITREDILGKSRNENAAMARCILVCQLLWAGFTVTTVSALLHRSPNAIRHICEQNGNYVKASRAYRLALSEATMKCKNIEPKGI